mmetsp:Transcript_133651/g.285804  ORF Transcript_133651/g.285804 Transcript_133651/m.285804 type:complete len:306 (-) Transcript_133651:760-1677(-)
MYNFVHAPTLEVSGCPSTREEFPLEAVEPVHSALSLCSRTPDLEAKLSREESPAEFLHGLGTQVLHPVPDALGKVGQVSVHGALVLHRARDALCHLHRAEGAEVAVIGSLFHGIDGAHAAIPLQAHAVVCVEILTRRLLRAGEQTPAHCSSGSKAEGLHNVPWARDATIRDDGHAVLFGKLCNLVDSRGLGPPAGADLLRGADRADAHAYTKGVGATFQEVLGLPLRDNIACHHLETGELLLHPLDHVTLEHAVPLAAVDDDCVDASADKHSHAVTVRHPGAHCRGHPELPILVFRGQGELCVLL